ncbi:hypothetical protein [Micromonospora endolithica]|uniref:Uncharacterized protein n=1 Tax=Micromonospora endolithica TaxID=230091 RepID=A0A3A9YPK5_9ACTN|nr:hypothetical protein [Micromonospora endolithica]RKN37942.1 hypothetical protein D7223_31760 [Micromonospora endolithica]TWJ22477.1 hypothetical protein JD76_02593 [Micromonospora endolithica]
MTGPRPGPPPGPRPGPTGAGPGGPRPGPPPGGFRPGPPGPVADDDLDEVRHPAVDAAVQAMANAAGLAPADQIAQYEAAYQTLRETLATIDQS